VAGCDKELLLRKDDLLKFIQKDDDWSLVENAVTSVRGHVPNAFIAPNLTLEAEPWFFGKISRAKAGSPGILSLHLNTRSLRSCSRTPCASTAASSSVRVR
jgi:hypothetical protein